jgi:hypothetical protein
MSHLQHGCQVSLNRLLKVRLSIKKKRRTYGSTLLFKTDSALHLVQHKLEEF